MTDLPRGLTFALLSLMAPAHAGSLTPQELSILLAATPHQVEFTETRHSWLLEEPMTLEGRMAYEPPDRLVRSIRSPSQRNMTLTSEFAIVSGPGGKERRINIASQPALQIYALALRGLLSGNLPSLEDAFAISIEGDAPGWRLTLVPREKETRRHLEEVDVSGEQSRILRIVVRESADDWSQIDLSAP